MAIFGITREAWVMIIPFIGFGFGHFLDVKETERMIRFRDKSALYGGNVKEGEQPTWP
ncbi:NADH dehydrogenase (ubiquinone) MNLL subunit [Arctopsyche grandis]|uniref:NADH dehydrogenase (ubiquinone) MNLL subunit n=1 Tax=Arctopsyche grandis TaxID=121162 RepID=UPI00406D6B3D